MACTLAESLNDPFHRKLRQLRCLRRRFDCYRVERTSSRVGVAPTEVQRLSRRTVSPTVRLWRALIMWNLANSKCFLLARSRRADRVGQQATQRTASSGISGRIPISSEELL